MPFKSKADKPVNANSKRGNLEPELIARFKKLIQSGMSEQQACQALSIAYGNQQKYIQKLAVEALTEQRLGLYEALYNHVQSNDSAAVFAAKAKLGWQDITKIEQNQVVEYVDLPDKESREAWQKRQALRLVSKAS
jgi:hypothetical protein